MGKASNARDKNKYISSKSYEIAAEPINSGYAAASGLLTNGKTKRQPNTLGGGNSRLFGNK